MREKGKRRDRGKEEYQKKGIQEKGGKGGKRGGKGKSGHNMAVSEGSHLLSFDGKP